MRAYGEDGRALNRVEIILLVSNSGLKDGNVVVMILLQMVSDSKTVREESINLEMDTGETGPDGSSALMELSLLGSGLWFSPGKELKVEQHLVIIMIQVMTVLCNK